MPIYEYRCEQCGYEMDALQKIGDASLVDCPECGRPAMKKLVSAAGFRLKGGGWYETDFKKGQKKNLHEGGEKKPGGTADGKKSADTGAGKKKESKAAGTSES
jgi:putative FmdB family regulatory protein